MEEKDNRITVLFIAAGEKPEVKSIGKELEDMQQLVGGYIEYYPLDENAAIICNEEGKNMGLPLNRAVYDDSGTLTEIIAGDFFICSAPEDSDGFESLSENQIQKYKEQFRYPEKFTLTPTGIVVTREKRFKSKGRER